MQRNRCLFQRAPSRTRSACSLNQLGACSVCESLSHDKIVSHLRNVTWKQQDTIFNLHARIKALARCKAPVNCTGSSPAGIMCEAVLTTQCDKYRETPLGRSRCYQCVHEERRGRRVHRERRDGLQRRMSATSTQCNVNTNVLACSRGCNRIQ